MAYFPVTGCLFVLELQRAKAGISNAQYHDSLCATAACTVRLLETSIADDDEQNINTLQADAWFASVRAASTLGNKGHRAILQVKNNKALFFRGIHSRCTTRYFCFVVTIDAGSTTPGKPYEIKFTDNHGNVVSI